MGTQPVHSYKPPHAPCSALHFAAALGKPDVCKMLTEAGADPDLQDKDGYTPLHMAAGYMHTGAMSALLEAKANPQIKDNTGKDLIKLVENLRLGYPLTPANIQRRIALEQVASVLTDCVYEEVEPSKVRACMHVPHCGCMLQRSALAGGSEAAA
jgi:signal recognition particle protein